MNTTTNNVNETCKHNYVTLNSWEDVKGQMIKLDLCTKCGVVVAELDDRTTGHEIDGGVTS